MDAIVGALGQDGVMNVDELRRGIESMPPERYESASYYERWLFATETVLGEKGVLAARRAGRAGRDMSYAPGQAVRVASRPHVGHHRTPAYVKGKRGTIVRAHGPFTNPETRRVRWGRAPAPPLYLVRFAQTDCGPTTRRLPDDALLRRRVRALARGGRREPRPPPRPSARRRSRNGDEPAAAARVRALEELLVERGVIRREDVRERIDWLVSRSPADGARLVARAWVDPEFKERLLQDARAAASSSVSTRGPSPSSSPSRTRNPCTTWSFARSAPATRRRCSVRRRTGTRAFRTARAQSPTHAECSPSSGSSSRRTPRCACSTRRQTSATW